MLFWTIGGTLIFSGLSFIIYLYFQKKGQFKNQEEVKYQIFRE